MAAACSQKDSDAEYAFHPRKPSNAQALRGLSCVARAVTRNANELGFGRLLPLGTLGDLDAAKDLGVARSL